MNIELNDAVKIITYLEETRTALARIGSRHPENPEELAKAACYFMLDYGLYGKLTDVYKILLNAFEENGELKEKIAHALERLSPWEIPTSISMEDIKEKFMSDIPAKHSDEPL